MDEKILLNNTQLYLHVMYFSMINICSCVNMNELIILCDKIASVRCFCLNDWTTVFTKVQINVWMIREKLFPWTLLVYICKINYYHLSFTALLIYINSSSNKMKWKERKMRWDENVAISVNLNFVNYMNVQACMLHLLDLWVCQIFLRIMAVTLIYSNLIWTRTNVQRVLHRVNEVQPHLSWELDKFVIQMDDCDLIEL